MSVVMMNVMRFIFQGIYENDKFYFSLYFVCITCQDSQILDLPENTFFTLMRSVKFLVVLLPYTRKHIVAFLLYV